MKKLASLIVLLTATIFLVANVFAAEGGNPRNGKALFKKTCKECHSKGAAAGEITPLTKTMSQWDRFFQKLDHNPDGLKNLSEQDLKDIHQFLYDHAADSPHPETCG